MSLREDAAQLSEDLVALRRELHQIPGIGLHLPRKQDRVLRALEGASYEAEYPVTANRESGHEFVAETVCEVVGEERFLLAADPLTASEDFSGVLDRVPGAFVFLGATFAEDPASAPNNHPPRATSDDSVLADGAPLLAELAARTLTGEPA